MTELTFYLGMYTGFLVSLPLLVIVMKVMIEGCDIEDYDE